MKVCTLRSKPCKNNDCDLCFNKSFASQRKSKYWSQKNKSEPRNEFRRSGKKFLFDCKCGHEFEISLDAISADKWCSYCCSPPQKLCEDEHCIQCFNNSFASHRKAKYWSEKNDKNPRQIFKGTQAKYLFNCKCGHEFESSIASITGLNTWCPYCSNPSKLLCKDENCQSCFEKSFASHRKSKYWSEKNDKTPRQVFLNTFEQFLFNCKCGHEFGTTLVSIQNMNSWCPYCCDPQNKLCMDENCQHCWDKSFASHRKSKYWSKRNKSNPREVFLNCNSKFWFTCKCGHEFKSTLGHVNKDGRWCSYCANQKLCKDTNCQQCWDKSFVSHRKSKYWSEKNTKSTRQVFLQCNKKFWFDCKVCKLPFFSFVSTVYRGTWCPICKHKTEKKVLKWLRKDFKEIISHQAKFDWCKNKRHLPFDICIEELKMIIEIDGRQHFLQVRNFKSPDETTENDIYKMKCALENGYSIIRICQEDVWNNKIDWKTELTNAIRKYDTPKSIYIAKDSELYDYHKF